MDIVLIIFGVIALLLGLIGCIVPMLPGPPLAYVALLLLQFTDSHPFTTTQLLLWLLLVAFVQFIDYLLPMLGTKYSGGGHWANRGCLVGTLLGLLFMPWGLLIGPFLGAYLGSLMDGRNSSEALRSGFGSLMGFLLGLVLKCLVCGYFVYLFVASLF
ncbi:MAG: DUF456 domain-containing protein [Bacteroides sp.]